MLLIFYLDHLVKPALTLCRPRDSAKAKGEPKLTRLKSRIPLSLKQSHSWLKLTSLNIFLFASNFELVSLYAFLGTMIVSVTRRTKWFWPQ